MTFCNRMRNSPYELNMTHLSDAQRSQQHVQSLLLQPHKATWLHFHCMTTAKHNGMVRAYEWN